ncbi:hypothetical protein A9K55_005230 [Cordyceps militaris]|uniref:Myb-like domain-containing protein n=1 Tax=Cordyceps militaris TaxID=73501 RepID=A0A2H4SP45_CORMI|nr:hypothetical protein A9K55_005230 [Cordyceps militaris]
MKASKHSRQPSDSATTSRRREAQTRNTIAQAQAYQQRLSHSSAAATYYAMPGTAEQDVYEAYHASTSVLPQQQQQYSQYGQPPQEPLSRRSGSWSLPDEQQAQAQYQQPPPPPPPPQKQQQRLLKQAEAKALLGARHRPSSGAWTVHDDERLIMARSDGLNWSQIQEQFFPGKSSNACRKRHERLIDSKGRGGGGDEAARMERIATEYVQMRERLWRPLADQTGEKWAFVERTCLSYGLKNLQGAARAASRRQRAAFDHPNAATMAANAMAAAAAAAGYDDDSGVSGIGLTPVDEVAAGGGGATLAYGSSSSPVPPSPSHNHPHHHQHGGSGSSSDDMMTNAAQSFASNTTTTTYLAHPHTLAQAHLHPAAYTTLMYGGAAAAQYHPQHAYSSSISSEGSLHPGYVPRRGNESA